MDVMATFRTRGGAVLLAILSFLVIDAGLQLTRQSAVLRHARDGAPEAPPLDAAGSLEALDRVAAPPPIALEPLVLDIDTGEAIPEPQPYVIEEAVPDDDEGDPATAAARAQTGVFVAPGAEAEAGGDGLEGEPTGEEEVWHQADLDAQARLQDMGANLFLSQPRFRDLASSMACWDGNAASTGSWGRDRNPAAWQHKQSLLFASETGHVTRYNLSDPAVVAALPAPPYAWQPPAGCSVPLLRFDRDEFCRLMRGRRILFIGDEIQAGFFDSFADLLGRQPVRHGFWRDGACPRRLRPDGACLRKHYAVCEGALVASFVRNDLLDFDGPNVGAVSSLTVDSLTQLQGSPDLRGVTLDGDGRPHVALPIADILFRPFHQRFDVIVVTRGWTAPLGATHKVFDALNRSLSILRAHPSQLESHYGLRPFDKQLFEERAAAAAAAVLASRRRRRRGRKLAAAVARLFSAAASWGGGARAAAAPAAPVSAPGGRQLRSTKRREVSTAYSPLIIYRQGVPPGLHPNCSERAVPLTAPPAAMSAPPGEACGAACDAREQADRLRRWLGVNYPNVLHMPVAVSTSMRPDAHINPAAWDCDAYQGLGPYDHWVRVLFNTLRVVFKENEKWDERR